MRPNILVIIVDQLRYPTGNFTQGLLDHAAPNLARLRRRSVHFDSHYAAATACSPSRACLLTGLYTHQNGIFLTNLTGFSGLPSTPDLNPGFPTWGTLLRRDFGYRTYWWGKWHLSGDCHLDRYGFERNALPCPSPNGSPGQGLHVDPSIADLFIHWLNAYGDSDPWCTTVSLVNPHDIQWFPKYTRQVPGEANPPAIPQFHAGLPANYEPWPQALWREGKPAAQAVWALLSDAVFGFMPTDVRDPGPWSDLLDLYYLLTQDVDQQIGRVLAALEASPYADNTIVIFTSDHGEYGGAHGLRGKSFAVYEESIHVPLYVFDPTGEIILPAQRGTGRSGLTSHVDMLPLLLTLASGSNEWRRWPEYAHLANRADLVTMLRNPQARGREYILHTSDESIPEELPKVAFSGQPLQVRGVPEVPVPLHVIGYRTRQAKLGLYTHWAPGTIQILPYGQQAELYDYIRFGTGEVVNSAAGGSCPQPALFQDLCCALLDPQVGAVATELRQPLPPYLQAAQRQAISDYLSFEAAPWAYQAP